MKKHQRALVEEAAKAGRAFVCCMRELGASASFKLYALVRSALSIFHSGDIKEIEGVKKEGEQNDMAEGQIGAQSLAPQVTLQSYNALNN